MNPIVFAMRHPITVVVALAGLLVGSGLALLRMKVDIFPNLNLPVVYVVQPYGGMDPAQMEGLLTFHYENHFLYISGIHHVESRNIQGFAQMKIFFHPGTDMVQAMAEVVAQVNRARSFMPPGSVAPFVVRFDAGSVPVGYIVLESETSTIDQIQEAAYIRVRPSLVSLRGVSAPPPFGGNQRTIVVHVDPDRLRAYGLSPNAVVSALSSGNAISPSGNLYLQDQMPIVPVNAMVADPQELGNIPVKPGSNVYLRDLVASAGGIEDGSDIRTSFALVNGRRAVYMMVSKRADASTLAVVNRVKAALPAMQAALPDDIHLRFEFDQSPYVTRAMWGVATEGAIGAVLTGLMVLLFLRDWRSVIVVVLNIPFALLAAVVALWATGQTINLMTLGGLALAVGILVDEATVAVENIHVQMEKPGNIALAVWYGTTETAVPRLLAMLCILAVFLPSAFMEGAARELFVPLSLAVGFAMIASFILSSTFVPVLAVWLLKARHSPKNESVNRKRIWFSFETIKQVYAWFLRTVVVRLRLVLFPVYLIAAAICLLWIGPRLGTEIFPAVDSGQFQLRVKAPIGTRIERTEEIARQTLAAIRDLAGADNGSASVAFGGVSPSSYTINTVYLWTAGPEEVVLRVALKPHSGIHVERLKNQLRDELPQRIGGWLGRQLTADGLSPDRVATNLESMRFTFEPADIVNEVMSFGASAPIEVAVSGPNFADSRAFAAKVYAHLAHVPTLRDLRYVQSLNYPTVEVQVDRERAGLSGVTAEDVARSLVAATSSSRFVVPNYWRDPKNGVGYQVQVEVPQTRMDSVKEVAMVPIKHGPNGPLLLRDVAEVVESTMPGEYDRYNMRRVVSMTANIEGEDLGRVANRIDAAIKAAGEPPRGVTVDVRGQVVPLRQMFAGLTVGLVMAVVVIFLLLTAYFQSMRLALVAVTTVPAVLTGVVLALWLTGTTLNIQSFMGAIMAVGVAVANAILLVTFAERHRREDGIDPRAAAVEGGRGRLRPILMTSFAMIAGMMPMALGHGDGGEQTAPLGRAVIGGLAMATVATLLILPAAFALIQSRAGRKSVSLYPFDPASRYYTPPAFRAEGEVKHPDEGGIEPPSRKRGILRNTTVSKMQTRRSKFEFPASRAVLLGALLATTAILSSGCDHPSVAAPLTPVAAAPEVRTARPRRQTLSVTVEQPGRVEAFEETPIYAKINGYAKNIRVEIGTRVHKGDLLAELDVPEMIEDVHQKQGMVTQANLEIRQTESALQVAGASQLTARSLAHEAVAGRKKAQADVQRWQSECVRMEAMVKGQVIDAQTRDESRNQCRAAEAALEGAEARVQSADAAVAEAAAKRNKAETDVAAARNHLLVAQADERRSEAMLGYARITAPFDGIVADRRVHTGHFLQSAAGGSKGDPMFVVVRIDKVRVFVDVPEADAVLVRDGSSGRIRVQVLNDREFDGVVAGTSWTLEPGQRTLRTEIDFTNADGLLRPGMYVHALIGVRRMAAWTIPSAAIIVRDGQTFCCRVDHGKAVRMPLKIGIRDGAVVELLKKQVRPQKPGEKAHWEEVAGDEDIVLTHPGELNEDQVVRASAVN